MQLLDNDEFVEDGVRYVESVAGDMPMFTVDHVTARYRMLNRREPPVADLRAWGLVMREAQSRGLIRRTAYFVSSRNPNCHATPRRVWTGWGA
jgi:hypothetical protein